MSGVLVRAVEAAERRSTAALGLDEDWQGVSGADDAAIARIYSGFDIDPDELQELAQRAGQMYMKGVLVGALPLSVAFTAAWCNGLLVGLLTEPED